jgi:hypothetical protein
MPRELSDRLPRIPGWLRQAHRRADGLGPEEEVVVEDDEDDDSEERPTKYRTRAAREAAEESLEVEEVAGTGKVKRRRIRLSTQHDVSRELRQLYRAVANGEVSETAAMRRARILQGLAHVLSTTEIEKKLRVITNALQARGLLK